jgi:O-antigen/teichoic acid export membrane protein
MTLVIMLGGAVCGVEVLGWLYGVELTQYRMLFVTLLAFGGFAAIVAFLVVVLTIVRKQKFIVVAYLIAAAINVFLSNSIVLRYKIWGAGIVYGITMGSIVTILLLTYIFTLRKECKGDKDEVVNEAIS